MYTYNRLPNILNRNIAQKHKVTKEQINSTFAKEKYSLLDKNERYIFSKFIKEVEFEDIDTILKNYDFTKDDIKRLYATSPFLGRSLLSKEWNEYFNIKIKPRKNIGIKNRRYRTPAVNSILQRRGIKQTDAL